MIRAWGCSRRLIHLRGRTFSFTGEQADSNGLIYLRARYYDPSVGVFTALDPLETPNRYAYVSGNVVNAAVGELMGFHNRYSYVNGNPVNLTDPSGMCPDLQQDNASDQLDAIQCRANANYLRTRYNVNILWQDDNMSEIFKGMCLEATQSLGVSEQDKLPWTTSEVRTIHNAFRIFDTASRRISELYNAYPAWRQQGANVKFVKLASIAGQAIAGLSVHDSRTIALSQDVWSDTLNEQTQVWLALHEFNHIVVNDRAEMVNPGNGDTQFLNWQIDVRDTYGFPQFGVPTSYAYKNDAEYIIEAITGTMWNQGYELAEYDLSAGGRYVSNVDEIRGSIRSSTTLEEWVINSIFGSE
mgnify:CR=1 FL=1